MYYQIIQHIHFETNLPCVHGANYYDYPVFSVASWGGQLVVDVVVFLLTLWKSLQSGISSHRSLIYVFLRDGKSLLCFIAFIMFMNLFLNNIRYYVLWVSKNHLCLVRLCHTLSHTPSVRVVSVVSVVNLIVLSVGFNKPALYLELNHQIGCNSKLHFVTLKASYDISSSRILWMLLQHI